jgi:hypothetical protein
MANPSLSDVQRTHHRARVALVLSAAIAALAYIVIGAGPSSPPEPPAPTKPVSLKESLETFQRARQTFCYDDIDGSRLDKTQLSHYERQRCKDLDANISLVKSLLEDAEEQQRQRESEAQAVRRYQLGVSPLCPKGHMTRDGCK